MPGPPGPSVCGLRDILVLYTTIKLAFTLEPVAGVCWCVCVCGSPGPGDVVAAKEGRRCPRQPMSLRAGSCRNRTPVPPVTLPQPSIMNTRSSAQVAGTVPVPATPRTPWSGFPGLCSTPCSPVPTGAAPGIAWHTGRIMTAGRDKPFNTRVPPVPTGGLSGHSPVPVCRRLSPHDPR